MRRKLDFVKQQQMAMKLHRQGRNNGDYLWWIVTSLVLQARAGLYARENFCNHYRVTASLMIGGDTEMATALCV